MNLFLDSNIWLALYDSPRRDLEELEKLVRRVEEGRVAVFDFCCGHLPEVRLDSPR